MTTDLSSRDRADIARTKPPARHLPLRREAEPSPDLVEVGAAKPRREGATPAQWTGVSVPEQKLFAAGSATTSTASAATAGASSGQLPGVTLPEYRPTTTLKAPTPTEFTGGLFNPYAYVVGNPLRYVDPDGAEPMKSRAGTAQSFQKAFEQKSARSTVVELRAEPKLPESSQLTATPKTAARAGLSGRQGARVATSTLPKEVG